MHQEEIADLGEATEILYERYAATIFVYLLKHTRSREDAEDMLEDIFIAAMENEKFASLPEQTQVLWLWRVARNKVIDGFRRTATKQIIPLEQIIETHDEDDTQNPEQAALRLDDVDQVQQLLQQLPPLQRKIVQLRFGHNLRSAEIAAIVGKRDVAVRSILSRTMNLLRSSVGAGRKESE